MGVAIENRAGTAMPPSKEFVVSPSIVNTMAVLHRQYTPRQIDRQTFRQRCQQCPITQRPIFRNIIVARYRQQFTASRSQQVKYCGTAYVTRMHHQVGPLGNIDYVVGYRTVRVGYQHHIHDVRILRYGLFSSTHLMRRLNANPLLQPMFAGTRV